MKFTFFSFSLLHTQKLLQNHRTTHKVFDYFRDYANYRIHNTHLPRQKKTTRERRKLKFFFESRIYLCFEKFILLDEFTLFFSFICLCKKKTTKPPKSIIFLTSANNNKKKQIFSFYTHRAFYSLASSNVNRTTNTLYEIDAMCIQDSLDFPAFFYSSIFLQHFAQFIDIRTIYKLIYVFD
jgi:hypothetical protein